VPPAKWTGEASVPFQKSYPGVGPQSYRPGNAEVFHALAHGIVGHGAWKGMIAEGSLCAVEAGEGILHPLYNAAQRIFNGED
jgi:hypothetical protein